MNYKFDWKKFRRDLRWAEPLKEYLHWRGSCAPMNQKDRAEILGISQSKLSRIETNADKNLKVDELVSMCEKMKVNPKNYFIESDE